MPLLAPLQPLFDAINASPDKAPHPGTIERQRADAHAALEQYVVSAYAQVSPLDRELNFVVQVDDGEIVVRIYASDSAEALPCHVYLHGGGFWLGMLDQFDPLCRGLAAEAKCMVASVGYRLAPEYKFPTAPEDCYAALTWLVDNAQSLGINPQQVSIGGMSAGGNLAAVVALMARDRSGPRLVRQVLELPITDLTNLEPLHIPDEDLEISSGKEVYIQHYLADPRIANEPYVSPVLCDDLTGLPPALIICAEYDPLITEAVAYAKRLEMAGVEVAMHICAGQFHGSQQMAALIPEESAGYQCRIARFLRAAYQPTPA